MLKITTIYVWRNKKTGRFAKAYSKGSRRNVASVLRWGKGTPKEGEIESWVEYRPVDFKTFKQVPFKKKKGTSLYRQFGDIKLYDKILKSGAKMLEVKVTGVVKGKKYRSKLFLNLKRVATAERIRDMLIARILKQLTENQVRLSSMKSKMESYQSLSKEEKERVYTPSEYRKMSMLKNIMITFFYV